MGPLLRNPGDHFEFRALLYIFFLQGSETIWRMLAERKIVTPIKNGEVSLNNHNQGHRGSIYYQLIKSILKVNCNQHSIDLTNRVINLGKPSINRNSISLELLFVAESTESDLKGWMHKNEKYFVSDINISSRSPVFLYKRRYMRFYISLVLISTKPVKRNCWFFFSSQVLLFCFVSAIYMYLYKWVLYI